jgi:hypothetical protein
VPLLQLDYDVATDLAGDVRPGPQRIGLAASFPPGVVDGGRVTAPALQVSYDDGATWTDVPVQAIADQRFAATYTQPEASATSGYVSLRVEATDGDGNSVDQTLIRAYRLR